MTDFPTLLEALDRQTGVLSSDGLMRKTPAYQEILKMGDDAVEGLLAALQDDTHNAHAIMVLLGDITGAQPVPKQDRGDVEKMKTAWLAWGK